MPIVFEHPANMDQEWVTFVQKCQSELKKRNPNSATIMIIINPGTTQGEGMVSVTGHKVENYHMLYAIGHMIHSLDAKANKEIKPQTTRLKALYDKLFVVKEFTIGRRN